MTLTPRLLTAGYLTLSVAALVLAYVLRHHPDLVTDAVWVRGSLVVASAVVANVLAWRGDVRRLRIVAIVMTVAIAVVVSIPGLFPVWLRIEQVLCGLLLLGVVLTLPRRQVTSRSHS
ncbi:hypothetical protein Dvina_03555 [Dactylosporangium vinaceum]|uniref:Integral membrane protein n=1 Tax=Dactylosporangium vinaceum TaxID=53362 RepID=A0ABV5M0X4_9ACTN|nr:hypothetical protein [Dactylosporangium vinaceum]UAB97278.1 hypothetical protein Dvina_03555 [Dactylosporangium vinaceum]